MYGRCDVTHTTQGKGPAAAAVKDMALRLRRESPLPPAAAAACRIHRAVLLDREVDPVTPLLTQITFEGLIDEVTGIRHGSVSYTPGRRDGPGAAAAPGPVGGEAGSGATGGTATAAGSSGGRGRGGGSTLLNSSDPFYKEFRDLPYYVTSQRCVVVQQHSWTTYAHTHTHTACSMPAAARGVKGGAPLPSDTNMQQQQSKASRPRARSLNEKLRQLPWYKS